MVGNDVAIPVVFLLMLAGVVGYLFLRRGNDARSIRRLAEPGVEKRIVVERVKVEEELSSCPKCGGKGGFHVAFRKGTGESERTYDVILVCPHCGFRFAVGDFRIPSGDPPPYDPLTHPGP